MKCIVCGKPTPKLKTSYSWGAKYRLTCSKECQQKARTGRAKII